MTLHHDSQGAKERCLELVNARRSFTVEYTGNGWRIDAEDPEEARRRADMSLRPRPGETAEDVLARVTAARS